MGLACIVFEAQPTTARELISYLEGNPNARLVEKALVALRTILSVEPKALEFKRLTEFVQSLEGSWTPGDKAIFDQLQIAYYVVASYGGSQAIEFLKERTGADFWKNHEMPVQERSFSDSEPWLETARTLALTSFGTNRSEETTTWLRSLLGQPEIASNERLSIAVNTALQLFPVNLGNYANDFRFPSWRNITRRTRRICVIACF